jgi:hypothetical protein
MGPRTGLDDVERRKFLTLPGLELRTLGRPDGSQSLYLYSKAELIFPVHLVYDSVIFKLT